MAARRPRVMASPMTLAQLTEEQLLARIIPRMPRGVGVLVGPGDDTAVVRADEATIVTTDAAVRGRDWRDEWSSPQDVGAKIVAQNLADVAAMGGRPLGLVVTLLADPAELDRILLEGSAKAREVAGELYGIDVSSDHDHLALAERWRPVRAWATVLIRATAERSVTAS